MNKEKIYHFTVILAGTGKNPDEAWNDAVEGFIQDSGATPEDYEIVEEE
jgi:hypothetical protein